MKARPTLTLCAAVTVDGKLDQTGPVPTAFFDSSPLDAHDVFLIDGKPAEKRLGQALANPPQRWQFVVFDERSDLPAVLQRLGAENAVRRAFCFGGPGLFRALFDAKLVHEIYLTVRPRIDGRRGAATLSGVSGEFFPASVRCRLLQMEVRTDECLLRYRVLRPGTKRRALA